MNEHPGPSATRKYDLWFHQLLQSLSKKDPGVKLINYSNINFTRKFKIFSRNPEVRVHFCQLNFNHLILFYKIIPFQLLF